MRGISAYIGIDGGGWYVEWYRDDDGGSGYGDEAEVQRWYGTRAACEERIRHAPSSRGWAPLHELGEGAPPYDAATATGMYDR